MRLLEKVYQVNNSGLGDVRIFSDRIFCYKRYHVDWEMEMKQCIQVFGINYPK